MSHASPPNCSLRTLCNSKAALKFLVEKACFQARDSTFLNLVKHGILQQLGGTSILADQPGPLWGDAGFCQTVFSVLKDSKSHIF